MLESARSEGKAKHKNIEREREMASITQANEKLVPAISNLLCSDNISQCDVKILINQK